MQTPEIHKSGGMKDESKKMVISGVGRDNDSFTGGLRGRRKWGGRQR
jgi:hypothetical protein